MTNEQLAGARRGLRGQEGILVFHIGTGLRLSYGGSNRDVDVTADMTSSEVEGAVKQACAILRANAE